MIVLLRDAAPRTPRRAPSRPSWPAPAPARAPCAAPAASPSRSSARTRRSTPPRSRASGALDAVETILAPDEPNPRVAAARGPVTVATPLGPLAVGGDEWTLMLGPCAVENEPDLVAAAAAAHAAGARFLRGGAFKPRTSPYAFQGARRRRPAAAPSRRRRVRPRRRQRSHVGSVRRRASPSTASSSRSARAPWPPTSLLKAAARAGRPVLLKRGFGATVDEWLAAAEYLLDGGAPGVILCERGIRSFEPGTRATLDLGGLALAKLRTGLPVVADPSHAAGTRALVEPLARAALAAGADGLIVECHPEPGRARSDGPQALTPDDVAALARAVARLAPALGRRAPTPKPLSCTNVCQPLQTTTSAPRSSASPR